MEAVKRFKKGRGERPSFLDHDADDSFPVTTTTEHPSKQQQQQKGGARKTPVQKSQKRMMKVWSGACKITKQVDYLASLDSVLCLHEGCGQEEPRSSVVSKPRP